MLCVASSLYVGVSEPPSFFFTLINSPSKNKPGQLRSPSSSPWAIRSLCLRFGALTLHSLCFQWTGRELCNRLAIKVWLCLRIPNALYLRKNTGQAWPLYFFMTICVWAWGMQKFKSPPALLLCQNKMPIRHCRTMARQSFLFPSSCRILELTSALSALYVSLL